MTDVEGGRRRPSIVVVDDDPFVLTTVSRMLQKLGCDRVETFDRAPTALARLDAPTSVVELILLDLNMPEVDGMAFIRELVTRAYAGQLLLMSGEGERVLQSVEHLVKAHGIPVLGHVEKPVPPETLGSLLDKWTEARRRNSNPNRVQADPADVRRAIDEDQLVNHYQPTVEVATGKVIGVEALVRWKHPEKGMIYPDQFIGVAESNGMIGDLTRNVVRHAIARARRWRDAGLSLRVAINVSMDNISSLDFADFVIGEAARHDVRPPDIALEVTESRLMQDLRAPLEVLARLRMKRFVLSIDDFGTGHSSLAQLRDIPFDELKIDRSFVHRAAQDDTVRAIYTASLGLATQLRMHCIAEGVEDREDWEHLRRTGCHFAQGYFIGRPMDPDAIPAWHTAWQERLRTELGIGA
jgi:EAL domain-containing protein (putative c-di-GMP-specific phosphodiesterase class I)/ActR/RegA family two-component response regulator